LLTSVFFGRGFFATLLRAGNILFDAGTSAAHMTVCKLDSAWSLLLLAALAGCHSTPLTTGSRTDFLARLGWSDRDEQIAWDHWAAAHLHSGDLVFVRGDSRILFGLVNFSQLCTDIADSRFSHVGLVSREQDGVFVYDVVVGGPRRVRFDEFATDRQISLFAVKRLKPEYRVYIPAAIEYCREVSTSNGRFDTELKLNNEHFYCSELIELAFRHAGLPLSQPVRIDHLPRFAELPTATKTLIQTMTTIEMDQEIFLPGNEQIGIWSCPCLDLVLDATTTHLTPTDVAALPMPAESTEPTGPSTGRNFAAADPGRTAWVVPAGRGPSNTERAPGPLAPAAYR
jgi:hypothetical protein